MQYGTVVPGIFLSRPNRFIAHVEMDGETHICHVKNTGRCKELLIPGRTVYLEQSQNPNRKTAYSLIAVDKDGLLVNMDSAAPNKVLAEALQNGLSLPHMGQIIHIKGEAGYGNSRFDFYLEDDAGKTAYVEVKGVTLFQDMDAFFPDAPTQRGVKHLYELEKAVQDGHNAYIIFIAQAKDIRQVSPNDVTHPAFGDALRAVSQSGVIPLGYNCFATPNSLVLKTSIPIIL
ncbi:DNA/RNA nuclease SfsA [Eubacteriales bacterium OttesenSCG-928-M02]|nr:DNA/RNA nuclease SfsA [Eubacteriales bacterium OttesenSCG-928-M02]